MASRHFGVQSETSLEPLLTPLRVELSKCIQMVTSLLARMLQLPKG